MGDCFESTMRPFYGSARDRVDGLTAQKEAVFSDLKQLGIWLNEPKDVHFKYLKTLNEFRLNFVRSIEAVEQRRERTAVIEKRRKWAAAKKRKKEEIAGKRKGAAKRKRSNREYKEEAAVRTETDGDAVAVDGVQSENEQNRTQTVEAVDVRTLKKSKQSRSKMAKQRKSNGRDSKESAVGTERAGGSISSVAGTDRMAMGRTTVGLVADPVAKPTKMRVRRLSSGGSTVFTRRLQSMYATSPTNSDGQK